MEILKSGMDHLRHPFEFIQVSLCVGEGLIGFNRFPLNLVSIT